jgi:hypothetical protein
MFRKVLKLRKLGCRLATIQSSRDSLPQPMYHFLAKPYDILPGKIYLFSFVAKRNMLKYGCLKILCPMIRRRNVLQKVIPVGVLLLIFSGCAATSQSNTPLVSQLQTRVGDLERELDTREARIRQMESAIKDLTYEMDRIKKRGGSLSQGSSSTEDSTGSSSDKGDNNILRVAVSVDKVQLALKNAGYYKGNVDGKIGKETRSAIRQFQTDNNLKADGVIGRKTWDELKTHLE